MSKLASKIAVRSFMYLGLGASSGLSLGCSGGTEAEPVGELQQHVWDYDENAGVFQPAAENPSLRENIVVSLWKPGKWSVAGASNTGDGCSGTLISPQIVLTSASCTQRLGTTSFDVYVGPRTPDVAGQATKFESARIKFFSSTVTAPSLRGLDLALVYLKTQVLEQAIVHRPPFTPQVPIGAKDADGWAPYAAGLAGWSPFTMVPGLDLPEARSTRQNIYKNVIGDDELRLNSAPVSTGLGVWLATTVKPITNLPKIGLAPGDNGGPLYVRGVNNRLDVIGVASVIGLPPDPLMSTDYTWAALPAHFQTDCATPEGAPVPPAQAPYQCDVWTNVTASKAKLWAMSNSVASATTRWRASHPRRGEGQSGAPWIGEVDYGGPCDPGTDPDCDHTYTWNTDASPRDNCELFNPTQADTADTGLGDACIECATQACSAATSCASLKVAPWSACGFKFSSTESPSGSYGSSACPSVYSAAIDHSSVPVGAPMTVSIEWADTELNATTCGAAHLELILLRQEQGAPMTATNLRYHGVWTSDFLAMCTMELDSGYPATAATTISRSSTETIRIAGSAYLQSGGTSTYKKVRLQVRTGRGPC